MRFPKSAKQPEHLTSFSRFILDRYNISVISERGRYRYLHPDRDRRITDNSLGSHYGKYYLEQKFLQNQVLDVSGKEDQRHASANIDYRKDPIAIFRYRSSLRLVVNLQENVKAMQSEAYARKVKIFKSSNKWPETLVYVQEHGYGRREEVVAALEQSKEDLETSNFASKRVIFSNEYFKIHRSITQANIMLQKILMVIT